MLDHDLMTIALAAGWKARTRTAPNPWVGAALLTADGRVFEGATEPPGQRHAERVAIDAALAAGADLRNATLATTLEPCSHQGRTGPCVASIQEAGIRRVLVGTLDPDPQVDGRGVTQLRAAGVQVTTGVLQALAERDLQPYLHHRRTGRPFVVLKLATTLDGRVAAGDGTSKWITSPEARRAVHHLRAISDAVLVGAGTVRADDPELTTRLVDGPSPRRVVLGEVADAAKVHPCTKWLGPIPELLAMLGAQGVLQLLVEGGPTTAAAFHQRGLVDRYVVHLAPAVMGDGAGAFRGVCTPTIADLWRGRTVGVRTLGNDVEIIIEPIREHA